MSLRYFFSASTWLGNGFTGRTARRVYVVIILFLLVTTTVVRVYSFLLTRRIHAVISGLSKLRIDETIEDEVLRTVPRLVRGERDWQINRNVELGDVVSGVQQSYYLTISNEPNWIRFVNFASRFSSMEYTKDGLLKSWILTAADLLGYRYIGFSATVVLLDGKISSMRYGIANELVFPQSIGNIVSIKSIHARWAPHQTGFEVRSTEDENLQYNVAGDDRHLAVLLTPEASPPSSSHVFLVNLSCFWNLFGCHHVRQIVPLLWQDKNAIDVATLARLKSNDPCPDRILAGRVKYLPDIDVLLLESTGFKVESLSEEGLRVDETWTHYRLIEVLRGRPSKSWESVRSSATVPYPGDYLRALPNMGLRWAKAGERVLAFSNLDFDSCRVVPATASALSAVRNAIPAPRRAEDELVRGLM